MYLNEYLYNQGYAISCEISDKIYFILVYLCERNAASVLHTDYKRSGPWIALDAAVLGPYHVIL